MRIIPVIDLMDGVVVHAKRGQRDSYRPIQTPLCEGSSPSAVIAGLLRLHGFDTVYVADLDALMGKGANHRALLEGLQQDYCGLRFWIDQGLSAPVGQAVPVIGSESLDEGYLGVLEALRGGFILSLDFLAGRLLGPTSLLDDASLWPDTLILMTLSRVGAGEGPDFQLLEEFRARWPGKRIIAAGGVRHADDLHRLEDLGVAGVLLASALHSGALGPQELRGYA